MKVHSNPKIAAGVANQITTSAFFISSMILLDRRPLPWLAICIVAGVVGLALGRIGDNEVAAQFAKWRGLES